MFISIKHNGLSLSPKRILENSRRVSAPLKTKF